MDDPWTLHTEPDEDRAAERDYREREQARHDAAEAAIRWLDLLYPPDDDPDDAAGSWERAA